MKTHGLSKLPIIASMESRVRMEKAKFSHSIIESQRQFRQIYMDRIISRKFGKGCKLATYFGTEVDAIDQTTRKEIANCYKRVFNESWGESWTEESALDEVNFAFRWDADRVPIISLLYVDNQITGFSWGLLLHKDKLSADRDMPFDLTDEKKMEGLSITKYWLESVVKRDRVFLLRELGVLPEFRKDISSYLLYPLYDQAVKNDHQVVFCSTNINSGAFKVCLGAGLHPIHFYKIDDLLLMCGDTAYARKLYNKMISGTAKKESHGESIQNIRQYFCRYSTSN